MTEAHNMSPRTRAEKFAEQLGIRLPILLAPMAGFSAPPLSIAVGNAGGMGACGALPMQPQEIVQWADEVRKGTAGPFQINLWIPEAPPKRDSEIEKGQRELLAKWGPAVAPEAGDAKLVDFDAQFRAILDVAPKAISSIMGIYPPALVAELKARKILWLATATTIDEAKQAEEAGADAIIAQGMEAGGHRGAFDAEKAAEQAAGLIALLPQMVDAVNLPVIAAGGIADARGVAAALILGASAVQIGTGFLRCSEAKTHPAYADRLAHTGPDDTILTRAFSGRPGRSATTSYVRAASAPEAPPSAPYPVQRGLTHAMRDDAQRTGDADRMQLWAGQAAQLAPARPAGEFTRELWDKASQLLP